MIQLTNKKFLTFLCLLLSLSFMFSCEKDDDNDGQVELISFGPSGALHGDTLRFFGRNLHQVTSIEFKNATVQKDKFISQTNEEIRVKIPHEAEQGVVKLKTSNGEIVTKTILNLNAPITITTVTTSARPGENITITGDLLNWVESITFANGKEVKTFVSKKINEIVVTVPADAQTGKLLLKVGGSNPAVVETTNALNVTLPRMTAMSPMLIKPGSNLTITGTDLDLTAKIHFTGVTQPVTSFVSKTATQIVVTVPVTAKKGKLSLEAASGVQTTSATDLDMVLPVISSISPNPIDPGTNLTITGTDLDLVRKVIFAGVAPAITSFVSQSATQIVVMVPAGARSGKVTVESASGVQAASAGNLTITLPIITSLSPNPATSGNNLTITGTGFDKVNSVTFVNAPAVTSFVSKSPTQIVVTVPNGILRGKVTLGVTNPNDTIQSMDILDVTGAAPPPTIALYFYKDAVTTDWNGWIGNGWGGNSNRSNAAPVREGNNSVRIDYVGGYGSPFQIGGATINLASYTTLKFSVFGAPGSAGKRVNIQLNGQNGKGYAFTVEEGKWTDYAVPLSTFTGITSLNEIWVQEYSGTGGFTIYLDALGLN